MNETIQQQEFTYCISNLQLQITACNEQDRYKLLFLEHKLSTGDASPRDILQWLNLQDIYFTAHFTYSHEKSLPENFSSWMKYRKYSRIYPVTGVARQKFDSSDPLVMEISEILNSSKYSVYKL